MFSCGFDLGASREGYEGVPGEGGLMDDGDGRGVEAYVGAMERRPPPAPERAWATLSDCWAAIVVVVSTSSEWVRKWTWIT